MNRGPTSRRLKQLTPKGQPTCPMCPKEHFFLNTAYLGQTSTHHLHQKEET